MTEEELNRIERRWNGNDNPGYMVVSSDDVHALIAEVRRLKKVDRAARFVLLEMRREFQRGDLIDVDELEEAINAAAEPSSPKP
jgi:tRNA(Ser,Leu) C12 N-acetylase TAN1